MSEDEGKQEEKFDFTAEGESLGYISLDEAQVLAIEHARDNLEFYGPRFEGVGLAWEIISADDNDDNYDIRLSFRPAGRFRGEPGIEQIVFDKLGVLRFRQLLDEPTDPEPPPSAPGPTPTRTPRPTAVPGAVFVSGWGTRGAGDGQFIFPRSVAVASDGSVYVADASNDRIQKFSVGP